ELCDRARKHAPVFERNCDMRPQRRRTVLGDRDAHTLGQRAALRLAQGALVERTRIARIADMRESDAERDDVLRHHDVGRSARCAVMTSAGAGMLLTFAIFSLPPMRIDTTSAAA